MCLLIKPLFEGMEFHIKDMGDISRVENFKDTNPNSRTVEGVRG